MMTTALLSPKTVDSLIKSPFHTWQILSSFLKKKGEESNITTKEH